MSEDDAVAELLARFERTQGLLHAIVNEYHAFLQTVFTKVGARLPADLQSFASFLRNLR